MISIVTPTYNTPAHLLERTWQSLANQSFKDFEWVVYDDSDKPDTFQLLRDMAARKDVLMNVYTASKPSNGNIGYVKHKAFMSAHGKILVELDHDDELTGDCLRSIYDTFREKPETKFVYSNWAEINEEGQSCRYPAGWAFGYGSDYWDDVHQKWTMNAPEINRTTVSHIVSAPNHVRVWNAQFYKEIGGHNPYLVVADDYELVLRTVLATKDIVKINKLLYIQHINSGTAQRVYNNLIQFKVPHIHAMYSDQLDQRFYAE